MKKRSLHSGWLGFCLSVTVVAACLAGLPAGGRAQTTNRVLLIYDASNSMNARWQSDTKMAISKRLLMNILDSLQGTPNLQMALRVYGHQSQYPPLDCHDTRLEVPFEPNNVAKIIHSIKMLKPKGATPIAYALEQAANDFPPCDNCRNLIILITDGIEECDGDPCAASAYLQTKGITLKPFIIGIGDNFSSSFQCVGEYYDASKEEDFGRAFEVVISHALDHTSAQVNLLDENGEPTETDVNMTFYDHVSGQVVYNYVHTINYRGLPDTLTLDPLRVYDLVVHTRPAVRADSLTLHTGTHNIIGLDAPQGRLQIRMTGSRTNMAKSLACIVRRKDSAQTLHVQYVNDIEKYLSGRYDIEILSLPRMIVRDVEIRPRQTTTVDLPMPGILALSRQGDGCASLYQMTDKAGTDKEQLIHVFGETSRMETLYLQPGRDRVVNRPKYNLRTTATRDKEFTIEAGATTKITL